MTVKRPERQRNDPRRERTRRALMDAALLLMQEVHSFNSISLREVARHAGVVPTAFYRHFEDMNALGAALIVESLRTVREELRGIRNELTPAHLWISQSISTFNDYLENNALALHLLLRERFGANTTLRHAIAQGVELFESELDTDLARIPFMQDFSSTDLRMVSSLIVNLVISYAERYLALSAEQHNEKARLSKQITKQLRLAFLGITLWKPTSSSP